MRARRRRSSDWRASSASVGQRSSRRARDVREHAAGAQAEQRDRDRQKREVVVHDDREDARQRELGHQQRGRHERDAGEVARGRRGRRVRHRGESVAIRGRRSLTVLLRRAFVARVGRVGAAAAARAVRRVAAGARAPSVVRARVRRLRASAASICHQLPGAIVSPVGGADAGLRALHGHLRRRGGRGARRVRDRPPASAPSGRVGRGSFSAASRAVLARRGAADGGDAGLRMDDRATRPSNWIRAASRRAARRRRRVDRRASTPRRTRADDQVN